MISEGSSVGFFRRGVTLAVLKAVGKLPDPNDMLMRWVRKGRRSGAMVWSRVDGTGSREHVVGRPDVTRRRTSSGERGERWERQGGGERGVGDGREGRVGGGEVGGGGKEDRISSTFLSKKLAKSSGQREVVGGGGGGLRRDEKVSKSFLGLEAEVWILAE